MTSTPPERRPAPFPEQLSDWFQLNYKYVSVGAAVIAAAALGYWFYTAQAQRNAAAAEQQLTNARRTLGSGNVQLATADLRKVVENYRTTRAGTEAALLLAEQLYQQKKFAEGIDVLDDFTTLGAAEVERSKIYSLIGDGRMELRDYAEAAADYDRAADASRFVGEKAQQRGKQARALAVAGDTAESRELWQDLTESDAAGVAAEARVRLGELTATRVAATP